MKNHDTDSKIPSFQVRYRMAETPHVVYPPIQAREKVQKLKKSNYYGILLYLLSEFRILLPDEKVVWIINYGKRLSDAELLKAAKFHRLLITNEQVLKRTEKQVLRVFRSIPFNRIVLAPEPRRIGTGYHDKGALRPRHRPRLEGERAFWSQDLSWILPPTIETEGKWLTANEVQSLIGNIPLELVLHQVQRNRSYSSSTDPSLLV